MRLWRRSPGKGRFNQLRSRWDVLHPDRGWACKCQERPETQAQIINNVQNHLIEIAHQHFREDHLEFEEG
ncbi:Eco29kI family restriction endonuclease [Microbulbifer sp. 2201CG32-9]|uniref:Eco29kI family restriction endonuclease n=1 Tax=Microbulbifer sp. 2201CG32-9 TaxID=3232309 RepID=UPI00345C143A